MLSDDLKDLPHSLARLQSLQAEFDASRGFNFANVQPRTGEDDRAVVDFAALALAGEVGEIANLVKKGRRALWLGHESHRFYSAAANELGDVAAYLMKLATCLGVDLELAYLLTICRNCIRFEAPAQGGERHRVVTICGPPGVGKTTTVKLLAKHMAHYIERSEDNPQISGWLDQSLSFDAFSHQHWFLQSMYRWILTQPPAVDVMLDQDPAAIGLIYSERFYAQGQLTRGHWCKLLGLLLDLEFALSRGSRGRIVIALDASPEVLRQRLHDRDHGRAPTTEWIESIRVGFDDLLDCKPDHVRISTDGVSPQTVADAVMEHLCLTML